MSLHFSGKWRLALAILWLLLTKSAGADEASLIISQPTAMHHGMKRPLLAHLDVDGSRDQLAYIGQLRNTLIVQSKQGRIYEIDIETGHIAWQTELGDGGNLAGFTPTANAHYVAALYGSQVYLLDRDNKGAVVWKQGLNAAPIAGPAMNEEFVYVPTYSELVEALPIDPVKSKRVSCSFRTSGRITGPPVITQKTIGWTSEDGVLTVIRTTDHKLAFRFTAGSKVAAPPGYDNGSYYVGSQDGYVNALDEGSGAVVWQFSAGDRVVNSPAAVGQGVYITNQSGGMFRVSADTGQEEWYTPNVRRFLAASNEKVYAEDKIGRLAVLDATAGGVMDTMSLASGLNLKPANVQTDRVILASSSGVIEALHDAQSTKPLDYMPAPEVKVVKEPVKEKLGSTVSTATAGATRTAPAKAPATPREKKPPVEKKPKEPKMPIEKKPKK